MKKCTIPAPTSREVLIRALEAFLEAPNSPQVRDTLRAALEVRGGGPVSDQLEYCERCGHTFNRDSSPNMILCWQCDEVEQKAEALKVEPCG
jgi:hypothetical protein